LSEKLPGITEAQKKFANDHCFEHYAFGVSWNAWCSHCGGISTKQDRILPTHVCPHCGKELKVSISKRRTWETGSYYTIITTIEGVQVLRHFIVSKVIRRGEKPSYTYNEVVQVWINEVGKFAVMALPRACTGWYSDRWLFNNELSIKNSKIYNFNDIDPVAVYSRTKVLPIFKRNGFNGTFPSTPQKTLIALLNNDNETLYKNKQYELFRYNINSRFYSKWKHAVNICNRNNYIVKDASLWTDYLSLLKYFGKDTHNVHYVCPKDLHAEHQKLLKKKQKIEEIEREKLRLEQDREREEKYQQIKRKFFDLTFNNENIIVTVLKSVKEFYEEGRAMHHCVYSNGYDKKKDALILSARTTEGERIETIEVNLQTYKIMQSRGRNNSATAYHEEIVNLVNQNMNLIKQCKNGKSIRRNQIHELRRVV
jgi:hypothetical protein